LKFEIVLIALFSLLLPSLSQASFDDPKEGHVFDLALTAGVPQLIAAELKLVNVPNFEFGLGFGGFPINS